MFGKLIPAIFAWLTCIITLALAPTIETYNTHVTTNVTAATNSAYMIGMTAIDDFGGFLMIISLLLGTGIFAWGARKMRGATIGDMLRVIGAVILAVISLAIFSGSAIGYIDELITAGSGFAKTAYGIITTIVYIGIIAGVGGYLAVTQYRKNRKRSRGSARMGRFS